MPLASATYLFSGLSDYFGGHGCNDNQALLYARYGRGTTLADIVEQLVDDSWIGEDVPEGLTDSDIREALVDGMLNDRGRADVASGAVADCAVVYADANELDKCREWVSPVGQEHEPDCAMVAEWREVGELEDWENPEVLDEDCPEDDDCGESPVFIVLLEWEVCEKCGEVAEIVEDYLCQDCIDAPPTEPQPEDWTISPTGALGGKSLLGRVESRFEPVAFGCDEDAINAAGDIMKDEQCWTDIWIIDDHGGCHMWEPPLDSIEQDDYDEQMRRFRPY